MLVASDADMKNVKGNNTTNLPNDFDRKQSKGESMGKLRVEDCLGININFLLREGYIGRDKLVSGSITWNQEGYRIGSMGVICHLADNFQLNYSANGEDIKQIVGIAWSACPYGNKRPWFACPKCFKRAGKIFYRDGRFACRHCQQLCYASQLEKVRQRGLGLSHKLYGRFERDDKMIYKPKGMHWATFDRIIARAQRAEEKSLRWLMGS